MKEKFSTITFEEILDQHAIVGDPDHAIERNTVDSGEHGTRSLHGLDADWEFGP